MIVLEIKWWLAALLGGACCGLAGFYLVALNLPFLGICLAHAAMAGGVFAIALGLPPLPCAVVAALLVAAVLGPVADRARMAVNTLSGILFSLTLGLSFLGIGLMGTARSEVLALLWGSLLLLRWWDIGALVAVLAAGLVLAAIFSKEIKAVLFDRRLAWMNGVPASAIFYGLLIWCGLAVTVNLQAVGGLMLYSLVVNPAAAARQLTERYDAALGWTVAFAVASACGGLGLSLAAGWPTGASIVIISSALFAVAAGARLLRREIRIGAQR
ncbi:MAG: metal ABC transporter permease [Opitutaceae bacterium]|nr:metal ABC transporter permease [Opitutaceae bacterium]